MPANHSVRLQDTQPMPPARPETRQHNPQQAVRLPQAETTRRALLQDGDLMAESNDLSLLSGTGPKCRDDQSQKSDEKWSHHGNDDDLTNGARTCIFNRDGVFGIHTPIGTDGNWSRRTPPDCSPVHADGTAWPHFANHCAGQPGVSKARNPFSKFLPEEYSVRPHGWTPLCQRAEQQL